VKKYILVYCQNGSCKGQRISLLKDTMNAFSPWNAHVVRELV